MSKWIGTVPGGGQPEPLPGVVPPLPGGLCADDILAAADRAALMDKKGLSLAALLRETAAGARPVVVMSLAAESPDFAEALTTHFAGWIAQGVLLAARACKAEMVVLHVADRDGARPLLDELLLRAPQQAVTVSVGAASPVLREDSALLAALSKLPVRSGLLDTPLAASGYGQRPTLALDMETAIWLATSCLLPGKKTGKLVLLTQEGEQSLLEAALGNIVAALLDGLHLAPIKPLLLGGVTGAFIAPAAAADTRLAYTHTFDTLCVHADSACMASIGARLASQAQEVSCGSCVLCREGSWQLASILRDITEGRGRKGDLDLICDIGGLVQAGSLCSLGGQLAGASMSLVSAARDELGEHISRKRCPAGVCVAFMDYAIDPSLCQGCGQCIDACGEDAIEGKPGFIHQIDCALCTKCGKCRDACPEKAVVIATSRMKLPKKPTRVGRFR